MQCLGPNLQHYSPIRKISSTNTVYEFRPYQNINSYTSHSYPTKNWNTGVHHKGMVSPPTQGTGAVPLFQSITSLRYTVAWYLVNKRLPLFAARNMTDRMPFFPPITGTQQGSSEPQQTVNASGSLYDSQCFCVERVATSKMRLINS